MKLAFLYNGQPIEMVAEQIGECWRITLPNGAARTIVIDRQESADGCVSFEEAPKSNEDRNSTVYALAVARTARGVEVSCEGRAYVFTEPTTNRAGAKTASAGSGALLAPMVGVVADVLVAEGDLVAAYQPLAIVEAMKVMATIEAPFAGRVGRVYVKKGAQLAHGEPVMDIVQASDARLAAGTGIIGQN